MESFDFYGYDFAGGSIEDHERAREEIYNKDSVYRAHDGIPLPESARGVIGEKTIDCKSKTLESKAEKK